MVRDEFAFGPRWSSILNILKYLIVSCKNIWSAMVRDDFTYMMKNQINIRKKAEKMQKNKKLEAQWGGPRTIADQTKNDNFFKVAGINPPKQTIKRKQE